MPTQLQLFATCPKGLELLLVDELRALGAENVAEKLAGVTFSADLTIAYRACLWSRLANRILLFVAKFNASTPDELYEGISQINWDDHLAPDKSFAIQFVASKSSMTHTLYGAQKTKDAIVDQFRRKYGLRPNVDKVKPDVAIHVYLHRDEARVSIDLSGESLHKRGFRLTTGEAPLKENLAAAILLRSNWPAIAQSGGHFFDPMCGSGTLLIEAALMAGDIAPGLSRDYFGFLGWKQHDEKTWMSLLSEAKERRERGMKLIPPIIGYDYQAAAIKTAFENITRAGFMSIIHVEKRELSQFAPLTTSIAGLIVSNPPYGERLGEVHALQSLYAKLGEVMKTQFGGWHAAIFTGNPELGKQMGIRAKRQYALFNGSLPCKLLLFEISPTYFITKKHASFGGDST